MWRHVGPGNDASHLAQPASEYFSPYLRVCLLYNTYTRVLQFKIYGARLAAGLRVSMNIHIKMQTLHIFVAFDSIFS
jgi:hypothetical protein